MDGISGTIATFAEEPMRKAITGDFCNGRKKDLIFLAGRVSGNMTRPALYANSGDAIYTLQAPPKDGKNKKFTLSDSDNKQKEQGNIRCNRRTVQYVQHLRRESL